MYPSIIVTDFLNYRCSLLTLILYLNLEFHSQHQLRYLFLLLIYILFSSNISIFKYWILITLWAISSLSSEMVKWKSLSHVQVFETLRTVACQAPLSMGFSRSEYCSGLPCPSPGYLPNPGIKPRSSTLQVGSLLSEPPENESVVFLLVSLIKPVLSCSCLLIHLSQIDCFTFMSSKTSSWNRAM